MLCCQLGVGLRSETGADITAAPAGRPYLAITVRAWQPFVPRRQVRRPLCYRVLGCQISLGRHVSVQAGSFKVPRPKPRQRTVPLYVTFRDHRKYADVSPENDGGPKLE